MRIQGQVGSRYWLNLAGSLSITAGLIHVAVAPEHFEEWWSYGVTFLTIAVAQLSFGFVLLARAWSHDQEDTIGYLWRKYSRLLYFVAIAGNASVISLYLLTRTVGIPLGPSAGEIETITTIGLVSKFIEVLLIGCLLILFYKGERYEPENHSS